MSGTASRRHLVASVAFAVLALMAAGRPAARAQSFEVKPNLVASADFMKLLPAEVRARGTLNGATTDANAPWSFVDNATGKAMGVDVDLMNEAARRLGLTVSWSAIQFAAGIPGVESGRYDFYVSAMADTAKREQVVNFIAYSQEGSGVIVPKGNPVGIKTMSDLCGKRVAIVTGSIFTTTIADLNKSCTTPIQVSETADQAGPYLAVVSGQADATMNTYGVSAYDLNTATGGIQTKLELSPVPRFAPANQGIAFSKKASDLMAALAGALQSMKADGTYTKIMEKWSVGAGGLDNILINAALF